MRQRGLILIVVIVLLVAGVVAGYYGYNNFFVNSNGNPLMPANNTTTNLTTTNTTNNNTTNNTSQTGNAVPTATATASSGGAIDIQQVSITTGHSLESKSHASVYIGQQHAGESVSIVTKYYRDGSQLNPGNTIQKTVSSAGYVEVDSANAFKYYPDTVIVTVNGAGGSDTVTCNLNIESGTQTCNF